MRWWQQARTRTPLAALLLDVRALEVIASRVGTTWETYIGDYLRTTWIRMSIQGELTGTVHAAIHRAESLSSEEHRHRVEAHRAVVMSFMEGGFTIDPQKCLHALPELAAMFPCIPSLAASCGHSTRTSSRPLVSAAGAQSLLTSGNDSTSVCSVCVTQSHTVGRSMMRASPVLADSGSV